MSLFDELLKYEESSSSSSIKPVSKMPYSTPPKQGAVRPVVAKSAPKPTAKPKAETHKPPSARNAKVEKVDYVKYDSEGCKEHYNNRYVSNDHYFLTPQEVARDYSIITQAIVLGEALATPRYKKPWRPR